MRTIVSTLLFVTGTVVATVGFARTIPTEPGWEGALQVHFPSALSGLALMLAALSLRYAATREKANASDRTANDGPQLTPEALLARLREASNRLEAMLQDEQTEVTPEAIATVTTEHLEPVLEARWHILRRYGGQKFAALVGAVAEAERWLNRAWSAAVDGYPAEARAAAEQATTHLGEAVEELHAWTATA